MATAVLRTETDRESVERLADIIISLQRCFILRLSEELAAGQVSFAQYFLLCHIADCESLSMTEVADKMNHSTAAASGLVDRLENLDYVQRTHAPNDRRKVLVKITKKGSALVEKMRQNIVLKLDKVMELLSVDERRAWLCIYEKVFSFCQSEQISCEK